MTAQDRQGWRVVAALAVVSFLLLGSTIGTIGIFFHPLIQSFGWSHEQVSRLATAFLLCMGLSAWLAGWMLDRMPAQVPMGLGALAAGIGYFLASRCHSLGSLTAAFALIGAGVGQFDHRAGYGSRQQLVPESARPGDWSRYLGQPDGDADDSDFAHPRDPGSRMAHRDAVPRHPDFCHRTAGHNAGSAHAPGRRSDALKPAAKPARSRDSS